MSLENETILQLGILLPLGLLAMGILIKRGCFAKDALVDRPVRTAGLIGTDLAIGAMLLLFGIALAQTMVVSLGLDAKIPLQNALSQLVMQCCIFSPVGLYTYYKIRSTHHSFGDFGLSIREKPHWQMGVWASILCIPILIALSALMGVISTLLGFDTQNVAHELLETIHKTKELGTLIILLVSAIIAAPLFEEFIFRGYLLQGMRDVISQKTPWVNVIISSVIFAGIHANVSQWQTMPALFILGCMLGWMYEKSGSLWPCIILHATFNAFNIGIVLLLM